MSIDTDTTPDTDQWVRLDGENHDASIDRFEVEAARRALALLKNKLGRERMLDLLTDEIAAGSAYLREQVMASAGQETSGRAAVGIASRSAQDHRGPLRTTAHRPIARRSGGNNRRMATFVAENLRDWRDKGVIDPEGNKIGALEAVYFDTTSDEPVFATVKVGMIGRHKLAFVPLDGATVSPDAVRVRYAQKQVKDAPTIGTDGELAATDEPAVFAYYGIETSTTEGRRLARR